MCLSWLKLPDISFVPEDVQLLQADQELSVWLSGYWNNLLRHHSGMFNER